MSQGLLASIVSKNLFILMGKGVNSLCSKIDTTFEQFSWKCTSRCFLGSSPAGGKQNKKVDEKKLTPAQKKKLLEKNRLKELAEKEKLRKKKLLAREKERERLKKEKEEERQKRKVEKERVIKTVHNFSSLDLQW